MWEFPGGKIKPGETPAFAGELPKNWPLRWPCNMPWLPREDLASLDWAEADRPAQESILDWQTAKKEMRKHFE